MTRETTFLAKMMILGAGGLAREVLAVLRALAEAGNSIACCGFIVDPEFATAATVHGVPVHRGLAVLQEDPEIRVIVALGNPAHRRRAVQQIEQLAGPRFASAVHPAASIGADVPIGVGMIVLGPASITTDVSIGRHVLINPMVSVSHDCRLADYATLAPGVVLAGGAVVEEGAELGTGASVMPRQTVGAWSMVGAGATVVHAVPANAIVAGVPASCIRTRPPGWQEQMSRGPE